MKKITSYLIALAVMAFTFTSCEDVPAPFGDPINPNESTETGEATGTGTQSDPFNIAAAVAKCVEIGSTESTEKYYVKGIVVTAGVADGTYGNASFDMADAADSKVIFKAFQVLGSDGQKMPEGYKIEVGDEVIIYGPIYNYKGNTPETAGKGAAYIYSHNGKKTDGSEITPSEETTVDPQGTGTADDPFNVAAAIAKCKEIGQTASTDKYYIKGIADTDATPDAQYGNATFNIVDKEGSSEKFYCFQVALTTSIKKGDVIVVYGPIYNFKGNTPETAGKSAASVVSINGQPVGGDTPAPSGEAKGTGTAEDPFNVAAAIAKCQEIGTEPSTEQYYVKGIANSSATPDATYGNASFYIVDKEGSSEKFYCYQVALTTSINKGDIIVVYGPIYNYKGNTPETAGKSAASVVSITPGEGGGEGGEGGGGDVSGNSITVTFSSFGFSNAEALTTITLTDNTTLTFDGGGNTNSPKYYNAGTNVRMYAKNTMTINAGSKKIAAIEISCDTYNGTLCNAGGSATVNGTQMRVDGTKLKFTGPNASTATVANTSTSTGTASQIRMTELKITYAD